MRITTDACLFGAYVARHTTKRGACLDIGAGTGLLSLMLAQRGIGPITALELHPKAAEEAAANFEQSPWSHMLHLIPADARYWNVPESHQAFPLIISNPPFFTSALRSPDAAKRTAMHQESLTFDALFAITAKYLQKDGQFWVLIPYNEAVHMEYLALTHGLYLKQRLDFAELPDRPWLRSVMCFDKVSGGFIKKEQWYIKEAVSTIYSNYSKAFKSYLADFYLEL